MTGFREWYVRNIFSPWPAIPGEDMFKVQIRLIEAQIDYIDMKLEEFKQELRKEFNENQ